MISEVSKAYHGDILVKAEDDSAQALGLHSTLESADPAVIATPKHGPEIEAK